MEYGEFGDEFFIIIEGVVRIQLPNKTVKDWTVLRRDYKFLLDWKKKIFDPKAQIAKNNRLEDYQKDILKA